jgi:hypothetical protein
MKRGGVLDTTWNWASCSIVASGHSLSQSPLAGIDDQELVVAIGWLCDYFLAFRIGIDSESEINQAEKE